MLPVATYNKAVYVLFYLIHRRLACLQIVRVFRHFKLKRIPLSVIDGHLYNSTPQLFQIAYLEFEFGVEIVPVRVRCDRMRAEARQQLTADHLNRKWID